MCKVIGPYEGIEPYQDIEAYEGIELYEGIDLNHQVNEPLNLHSFFLEDEM